MAIRMFVYLSFVAIALTLTGCSMTDDVKEAKETSKDMDKKLDGMVDISDNLLDRTSNLFGGARKDLSFTRVTERYEDILDHSNPTLKILFASALSRSYAFQQWTGTRQDTPELKLSQQADSMRDFLWRFEPLVDHESSPDLTTWRFLPYWSEKEGLHGVAIPLVPGNEWKSAASMSVALGEIDPDQVKAAKASGVPPESLYSLIVKGLQYKQKSHYTDNFPEWAQRVLDLEGEAVYLLQMRHNYFLAMVMSRFTDFSTAFVYNNDFLETRSRDLKQFWSWLWVNRFGQDLDVQHADNLQKVKDEALLWLQQAQETQIVLQELGYPLKFNGALQQIFAGFHMKAPQNWVGLPEVDKTFSALDKLTSELQYTARIKKAPPGKMPKYLQEPAALLTKEELGNGIPRNFRQDAAKPLAPAVAPAKPKRVILPQSNPLPFG